eukprot:gene22601-30870_t
MLRVGLFLRSNCNSPEVAYDEGGFACLYPFQCGLSCSLDNTFSLLCEILGSEVHPFTSSQLKKKYGNSSRAFCVASLEQGDVVDPANWHVEHDEANGDSHHVTISPARDIDAVEILDCKNKVGIPLLEQLPWNVNSAQVLIVKARAEWREDFFPYRDEWSNCVTATFNRILAIGGTEDFLNVWQIHRMISADIFGPDAQQDVEKVITLASTIIRSYLDDLDVHDPNDPDATAQAALRFLQTLQARFGEEVPPLFLHGNMEEFDSQLGLFGVHAAAGSLHGFRASISDEMQETTEPRLALRIAKQSFFAILSIGCYRSTNSEVLGVMVVLQEGSGRLTTIVDDLHLHLHLEVAVAVAVAVAELADARPPPPLQLETEVRSLRGDAASWMPESNLLHVFNGRRSPILLLEAQATDLAISYSR